jgi:hypothetical protein
MNIVYEGAITRSDADVLPVPSARGVLQAVRTRIAAARRSHADQAAARRLAECCHEGVLADYRRSRDCA